MRYAIHQLCHLVFSTIRYTIGPKKILVSAAVGGVDIGSRNLKSRHFIAADETMELFQSLCSIGRNPSCRQTLELIGGGKEASLISLCLIWGLVNCPGG